jgi:hypothetical protein
LLCPAHVPHRHEAPSSKLRIAVNGPEIPMLLWPGMTCAYHLPASTAPLGTTRARLLIGLQIVAPSYGDRTALA